MAVLVSNSIANDISFPIKFLSGFQFLLRLNSGETITLTVNWLNDSEHTAGVVETNLSKVEYRIGVDMNQVSHPTVILGGGFVGLFTALHLGHQDYPHPLVLIERGDRFSFKPLLYELLTGELHAELVCPLYAKLLSGSRVSFVQDTVKSIDLPQRQVVLASGKSYDYRNLVLALGGQTNYFKTPGAAENSFSFTSATEAVTLRARLQDCLQTANSTKDREQRLRLLTVAIIGAGPAGVELACTLADILPVWYEELGGDYEEIRVVLVNRSHEILKGDINSRLRDTAREALDSRTVAVELLLDAAVTAIKPDGVEYKHQEQSNFLPAMTIVWTAGTEIHPLLKDLPVAPEHRESGGRLHVNPALQLPDFPEVFVGGDCAYFLSKPQPATAQVAYQQGKAIADNLTALVSRQAPIPARVTLHGTLMKLGIGEGVANIFDRHEVKGKAGHLIREATYLQLLPAPLYNFHSTAEWLTDELFRRHLPQAINQEQHQRTPFLAGVAAIVAGLAISLPLLWRAAQPEQFQRSLAQTGLPVLLNQLAPPRHSQK